MKFYNRLAYIFASSTHHPATKPPTHSLAGQSSIRKATQATHSAKSCSRTVAVALENLRLPPPHPPSKHRHISMPRHAMPLHSTPLHGAPSTFEPSSRLSQPRGLTRPIPHRPGPARTTTNPPPTPVVVAIAHDESEVPKRAGLPLTYLPPTSAFPSI